MENKAPEFVFEDAKSYYTWMIKYFALFLDKKMPSDKDIEFLLGIIYAKSIGILANTRNREFTEYYSNLNWHQPNIHSYKDRGLINKWIRVDENETFHFTDDINIPPPLVDGLHIQFILKVNNPVLETKMI